MSRAVRALGVIYLTLVALFLAGPLIVVIGISISASRRMTFPPQELSLRWYGEFFGDPDWTQSFVNSLMVASGAALAALSLALPIAYALWRFQSPAARALTALGLAPFALPGIVLAVVYLIFWSAIGHPGRIEDMIASHAIAFTAVPLTTLGIGFRLIDRSLLDAAATMGADQAEQFRTVVLPLILPYMVCGLVFVFVLSLNEYIIADMVAGFSVETLPIKVFTNLRAGFSPTMCVGATLFTLVGVAAFGLVAIFGDLPKLLGAEAPRH